MPKLGIAPIRREQIFKAAAAVIAREGFSGTTMRNVAQEAGVSTGMLNHYFSSRQDLLTQTLIYVSERSLSRYSQAIEGMPPGRSRLTTLLDDILSGDPEGMDTWRVWIAAYGEAVCAPQVRETLQERLVFWFELLDHGLEGLVGKQRAGQLPWALRLDAVLKGLATQALTSPPHGALSGEEVAAMVLGPAPEGRSATAPRAVGRRRAPAAR